MIIDEGKIVGKCPEHGVLIDDALDLDFPNASYCGVCGVELEKVYVLDEPKIIRREEVISEPEEVSE